jgi:hypothetical protein
MATVIDDISATTWPELDGTLSTLVMAKPHNG